MWSQWFRLNPWNWLLDFDDWLHGFVALMAAVVVALSARYLNGRTAFAITAGLFVWLIYVGLLGYFGVVRNAAMRLPGIAFIFIPVLVFLVLSILGLRSSAGTRVARVFLIFDYGFFSKILNLFSRYSTPAKSSNSFRVGSHGFRRQTLFQPRPESRPCRAFVAMK